MFRTTDQVLKVALANHTASLENSELPRGGLLCGSFGPEALVTCSFDAMRVIKCAPWGLGVVTVTFLQKDMENLCKNVMDFG